MARPLLLIDSASLYFRAYFGIPESAAKAPDGTPVNAVRGFLDFLSTLIRGRGPDRLVCCLDESWRPAWRVALIPSYKAHRLTPAGGEEVPDALETQVPIILEFLTALGITAVGAPDFEADDVIGTLAFREPGPVEVATGDRDLFQLIDDEKPVRVLYCGKGVANLEVLDNGALHAKYGVPAAGYADLATLRGDASDGLPGVAGVGEKTAARLIDRYGTLDNILAALADPDSGFAPGLRAQTRGRPALPGQGQGRGRRLASRPHPRPRDEAALGPGRPGRPDRPGRAVEPGRRRQTHRRRPRQQLARPAHRQGGRQPPSSGQGRVEQPPDRRRRLLLDRHVDRRQISRLGQRTPVETDHGNILGHPPPGLPQRLQHPHRRHVARREHRIHIRLASQQLQGRRIRPAAGEVPARTPAGPPPREPAAASPRWSPAAR